MSLSAPPDALLTRLNRGASRIRAAARVYGTSPLALAARFAWLRATTGLTLEWGFDSGLLDPRVADKRARQPGGRPFRKLLARLNVAPDPVIDDKAVFYARCAGYGLPTPRIYAVTSPELGVTEDGRALATDADWESFFLDTLPETFVIKPAASWSGQNVDVYEREAGRFCCGGESLTAAQLRRRVAAGGKYGRCVVSQRLANHPALADLSPAKGLQTVRYVTVLAEDGSVDLFYAYWKVITGAHLIDNYGDGTMGNLAVEIRPETGELGLALGPGPENVGVAPVERHPVTGKPYAGFRLPDWERLRALAAAATRRFQPMRAIAWDVALTPEGPMLIEGNTNWAPYCGEGFWFTPEQTARIRRHAGLA